MTRTDAALKVRGAAPYGTDLLAPGMLWGALVPAPVAHGKILRVDLERARGSPGVVAAIGAAELAELIPKSSGDPDRPLFPSAEIVYRHEPIAAIAARSLGEARAAVRAVVCETEPLPVVTDLEEVFPDWPGPDAVSSPQVAAHVHARRGDVDAALREADLVHAETFRTSGVHQVALEPHACLAHVQDNTWRVATSTQSPFGAREDCASILGLPEDRIVVEGTWVGGGFGGKGAAFLEPYALALSRAAGAPVKLALSYREEFLLGRTTLPSVVRFETGVRGGRITARRVRLLLDSGASLPGRDFATGYSMGFLLGPYATETFEVEGFAVRTNKPPFGPHRAPFAPQCAFMLESHLDGLARRMGVDPVEFRVAHAWKDGDRTPFGQRVQSFGLVTLLERAGETVQRWRRELPADHGIGVGAGFWSTNAGAGGEAKVLLTSGELVIRQGEFEIGSGSVIRGLVAVAERVTGLPADAIRVESFDTARAPFDSGVYGSRTVAALGQAVQKACDEILKSLGKRLGVDTPVHLERQKAGLFAVAGRQRRPVEDLFTGKERAEGGLEAHGRHYAAPGEIDEKLVLDGSFFAFTDFTAAVAVAEVAVDRETGQVRVRRIASFHDTGPVLDPEMFRGQVEGGVVMGLGAALTEETMWTSPGELANPGLLDYRIPTLGEIPPIEIHAVESFRGAGPFGAKGLGEPPIVPVPAAVANGVADATGARVPELPLSAERVARALKLL